MRKKWYNQLVILFVQCLVPIPSLIYYEGNTYTEKKWNGHYKLQDETILCGFLN